MKPMIRKVDGVGRISLSHKVLDYLHISEEDSVLIYTDKAKVILKKYEDNCVLCGNTDTILLSSNVKICSNCKKNQENISMIVDKRYEKQSVPNGRRFVIPFKIRNQLKIETGDKIYITPKDNYIEMEKVIE